jgi:hypothetical protein
VPAQVTPSWWGVTSSNQTAPIIEEEATFQNKQKSWKEQKYDHWFRRDPKSRLTVLARPAEIYLTGRLTALYEC